MAEDWFPTTLAEQNEMFGNIGGKIDNYELVLPLSAALVAEIETICSNFTSIYNFVETSDATS